MKDLIEILKEMEKDKQRLIVNTEFYNLHKDAFDEVEKKNHVIIHHYNFILKDKIYVVRSQRELEALIFKPLKLNEPNPCLGEFHTEDLYVE